MAERMTYETFITRIQTNLNGKVMALQKIAIAQQQEKTYTEQLMELGKEHKELVRKMFRKVLPKFKEAFADFVGSGERFISIDGVYIDKGDDNHERFISVDDIHIDGGEPVLSCLCVNFLNTRYTRDFRFRGISLRDVLEGKPFEISRHLTPENREVFYIEPAAIGKVVLKEI